MILSILYNKKDVALHNVNRDIFLRLKVIEITDGMRLVLVVLVLHLLDLLLQQNPRSL